MSWLVSRKVLPPLMVGEPPSYATILASDADQPPVGWTLSLNGRRIGWALSSTVRLPNEMTEVRSRVHFNRLPLEELTPAWVRILLRPGEPSVSSLEMEAESLLSFDPLGRLVSFDSSLHARPLRDLLTMRGTVEGTQMKLAIHSGELSYNTEFYLPPKAILADSLSPQARLPGLRARQTWTVPSYNPMRPPNSPMEILLATVEGRETTEWNGRREEAWLVVYRDDPGAGRGGERATRGRLWVRPDGTVLRQQVMVFDSFLTFVRMSDDRARKLAAEAQDP
jgi:hypothetical protein